MAHSAQEQPHLTEFIAERSIGNSLYFITIHNILRNQIEQSYVFSTTYEKQGVAAAIGPSASGRRDL